jgi:hypothetical protein
MELLDWQLAASLQINAESGVPSPSMDIAKKK